MHGNESSTKGFQYRCWCRIHGSKSVLHEFFIFSWDKAQHWGRVCASNPAVDGSNRTSIQNQIKAIKVFIFLFSQSGFVCADLTRKTDNVIRIKLGKKKTRVRVVTIDLMAHLILSWSLAIDLVPRRSSSVGRASFKGPSLGQLFWWEFESPRGIRW